MDHLKEPVTLKAKYIRRKSMVSLGQFLNVTTESRWCRRTNTTFRDSADKSFRALKQNIIKKIHETEKVNFDDIERRLMCLIIGEICSPKRRQLGSFRN